jgi:hypothetical protein
MWLLIKCSLYDFYNTICISGTIKIIYVYKFVGFSEVKLWNFLSVIQTQGVS